MPGLQRRSADWTGRLGLGAIESHLVVYKLLRQFRRHFLQPHDSRNVLVGLKLVEDRDRPQRNGILF